MKGRIGDSPLCLSFGLPGRGPYFFLSTVSGPGLVDGVLEAEARIFADLGFDMTTLGMKFERLLVPVNNK